MSNDKRFSYVEDGYGDSFIVDEFEDEFYPLPDELNGLTVAELFNYIDNTIQNVSDDDFDENHNILGFKEKDYINMVFGALLLLVIEFIILYLREYLSLISYHQWVMVACFVSGFFICYALMQMERD